MSDLLCPKCHNLMRGYERNGVHVDQCTECKGLFLDRGEFEQLAQAEAAYYAVAAGSAPPTPPPPRYEERRYDRGGYDRRDEDRWYGDHGRDDRYRRKRKRRSFLEELLDFD